MSPYNVLKHDVGLLRQDGSTKTGFILAKDKTGAPIYLSYDDEYILNQQTQVPGYDALPPEKEFTLILDDWRAGFGIQTYDLLDPKRYEASYNMDLRFKGKAFPAYKQTSVTIPTLFSMTDGGMETWTDANTLTNWTKQGANWTLSREATTIHGGTYSAKLTINADPGASAGIYQDLANWSTDFRNTTVAVTGWLRSSAADKIRIGIDDGVSATYSAYQQTADTWEQFTAIRKLDAAATRIRIDVNLKDNEIAGAGYVDDVVITTYSNHGKCWAEFDDDLFFSSGGALLRVANGTGTITFQGGMPANITSLQPFQVSGTDYLFIALGTSNNYYYMTTAEVFTESTAAVKTFQFFTRVYTTAETMYGNDSVNTIRSTTNPLNGGTAWSAQTIIDSPSINITRLIDDANALYIPKEDRVFYLDSTGAVKILAEDTRHLTNSTGGKNSFVWKSGLYMNYKSALLEYLDSDFTWLNPADYCTELSDFTGDVQAIAGDERYLFVAIDNSNKIEILAGHREIIDGTTKWVWHPIQEFTTAGAETMFVSSIYQKRLWIASTSSGDSLIYIPLPTSYGNVPSDTNRSFATDGSQNFTTPRLHANFKGDTKAFIKVVGEIGHTFNANIYFECHYKIQGDTVWTDAGDIKGSATSQETTLYIPADAGATNPTSKWIQFKLVAITNSATTAPILNRFEVRGILYPSRRDLIYMEVRGGDITTNDGTQERDNGAANIKTVLEEAKNTATWPVTFYDIDGSTIYVRFLPMKPFSKIVKNEADGKIERHYYLLLQKVTLS